MPRNCAMSAPATKPLRLGRADHQAARPVAFELVERGVELGQTSRRPACWRWRPACRTAARRCRPRRCAAASAATAMASSRASPTANGPSSRSRGSRMSRTGFGAGALLMGGPSNRFDQHGAALAATDAFGGDAALQAEPLHGVDEMQHDAVAAGADRMAGADRAAVDVEPVARSMRPAGAVEAAARRGRIPRPPRPRGSPAPARRRPRSAPTDSMSARLRPCRFISAVEQ